MAKKRRKKPKTKTLYSEISSKMRQLWRFSPERKARVKVAGGRCERCGAEVKGYDACVHHRKPVDFRKIEKLLRKELFVSVEKLEYLCRPCHHDEHHPKEENDE